MPDKPRDFVTSLARGLSVVKAFDEENREMTLSEVAEKTGMTRAGARRFLLTLSELGYVVKEGRRFRLTPKVLELGYSFMASMPISVRSQPFLNGVSDRTGESCSLAVLDIPDIVYIARSPARRLLSFGIHIGTHLPAYCSSMGRVLLAALSSDSFAHYLEGVDLIPRTSHTITDKGVFAGEIRLCRERGYGILDQEMEEGLRSLAVPVQDGNGVTIAAINISTNVATVSLERLTGEFLPILQQAARNIQDTLHS